MALQIYIPSRLKAKALQQILNRLEREMSQFSTFEEMRKAWFNRYEFMKGGVYITRDNRGFLFGSEGETLFLLEAGPENEIEAEVQKAREQGNSYFEERIQEIKATEPEAFQSKPSLKALDPSLQEWLSDDFLFLDKEPFLLFLEGPEWVKGTLGLLDDKLEELYVAVNKLYTSIHANDRFLEQLQAEDGSYIFEAPPAIRFYYYHVQSESKAGPAQVIFLHSWSMNAAHLPKASETLPPSNVQIQWAKSKSKGAGWTWDDLAREAMRAYPGYIVDDLKLWKEIEQERVDEEQWGRAHLALSSEEIEILQSQRDMPLFINGRAGSGKSTILAYLFAEYLIAAWEWKQRHGLEEIPLLFLTYSPDLLNATKTLVRQLLQTHPYGKEVFKSPSEIEEALQATMYTFRTFLEHLLGRDQITLEAWSYCEERYLDFPRFYRLYLGISSQDMPREWRPCHLRECRDFTPEEVWFAIRAYILGWADDNGPLTPERYRQVPRRLRVFSQEQFEKLYDVYSRWYRGLKAWTEIDLVLEALQRLEERTYPGYLGIFCDEAQDFTRAEFLLLTRLLRWRAYQLSKNPEERKSQIKHIPVVLAGDPLQTLNPSGFRWEHTRSLFYETYKEAFQLSDDDLDLQIRTLQFNYRSTLPIICWGNVILKYRAQYLQESQIELQQVWHATKDERPPIWGLCNFTEIRSRENLDQRFGKGRRLLILIPWRKAQEEPFATLRETEKPQDSILIRTPYEVKGLEYDSVILYGFGEQHENLQKHTPDEMAEKFFWTELYVGLTRARKYLYCWEPDSTYLEFWKKLEDFIGKLKECASATLVSDNQPCPMDTQITYLQLAHTRFEDARRKQIPELYLAAAKAYENAIGDKSLSPSQKRQAEKRKFLSYYHYARLRKEFQQAWQYLTQAKQKQVFDGGEEWEQYLLSLARELLEHQAWDVLQELSASVEVPWAQFLAHLSNFMIQQGDDVDSVLNLLRDLIDKNHERFFHQARATTQTYRVFREVVIAQVVKYLRKLPPGQINILIPALLEWQPPDRYALQYAELLRQLSEADFPTQKLSLLETARKILETAGHTGTQEYARIRAHLATDPVEAFEWWLKADVSEARSKLFLYKDKSKELWLKYHDKITEFLSEDVQQQRLDWPQLRALLERWWPVSMKKLWQLWANAYDAYKESPSRPQLVEWAKQQAKRLRPNEWPEIHEIINEHDDLRSLHNNLWRIFIEGVTLYPDRIRKLFEQWRGNQKRWPKAFSYLNNPVQWIPVFQGWARTLNHALKNSGYPNWKSAFQEERLAEWNKLHSLPEAREIVYNITVRLQQKPPTPLSDDWFLALWDVYSWLYLDQPQKILDFWKGFFEHALHQHVYLWEALYPRCRYVADLLGDKGCDLVKSLIPYREFISTEQFIEIVKTCCPDAKRRETLFKTEKMLLPSFSHNDMASFLLLDNVEAAQRLRAWREQALYLGAVEKYQEMVEHLLEMLERVQRDKLGPVARGFLRELCDDSNLTEEQRRKLCRNNASISNRTRK